MFAIPKARMRATAIFAAALSCTMPALADSGSVNAYFGSFGSEIPIDVPVFHGVQPSVTLAYNSTGGYNHAGVGWQMAAMSAISRVGPLHGIPKGDAGDIFQLDGQDMVPCTTYGGTHCSKILNYQRISKTTAGWSVWTKTGTKMEYATKYNLGTNVAAWFLSSVTDTNGNKALYNYTFSADPAANSQGTPQLTSIKYGPYTVNFSYDTVTGGWTNLRYPWLNYQVARGENLSMVSTWLDNTVIRAYKLDYSISATSGRETLSKVTPYGSDANWSFANGKLTMTAGTTLPAATMTYNSDIKLPNNVMTPVTDSDLAVASDAATAKIDAARFIGGDFDGDGRADFLSPRGSCACVTTFKWFRAKGDGTFEKLVGPSLFIGGPTTVARDLSRIRVGDFNGDGRSDVLYINGSGGASASTIVYANSDRSWTVGTGPSLAIGSGSVDFDIGRYSVADFNGDGKADIFYVAGVNSWDTKVLLGTGAAFTTINGPKMWVPSGATAALALRRIRLGDFDGDGRLDVLRISGGIGEYSGTLAAERRYTIDYFKADNTWASFFGAPLPIGNTLEAGETDMGRSVIADFNADGVTDLMYVAGSCSASAATIYVSAGNGFVWYGPARNLGAIGCDNRTIKLDLSRLVAADINSDGYTDVMRLDGWGTSGSTVNLNRGNLVFNAVPGPAHMIGNTLDSAELDLAMLKMQDVSGDGQLDMLRLNVNAGRLDQLYSNTGSLPVDVLRTFSNGLGATSTVNYLPSSAWVNTRLPVGMVMPTVRSVTSTDGRGATGTVSYSYAGALYGFAEKTFLGFRRVTAVTNSAGDYTETFYRQAIGSISKPETTYQRDAAGKIYNYASITYQENAAPPYTSLMTERWDYECNLSTTCRKALTQFSYDTYGNVLQSKEFGDFDLSGDERLRTYAFFPNTTAYIVGLMAQENLYGDHGPTLLLARQRMAYDGLAQNAPPSKGMVTKSEDWVDNLGRYIAKSSSYDAYGNRLSHTDPLGTVTTYSYDSVVHQFLTQSCNALGHCASTTVNNAIQEPTSQTEANGNTINYRFDVFGRPTRTTQPDGSYVELSYVDWGNPNAQHIKTLTSNAAGSIQTWGRTYQDGMGRAYKTDNYNGQQSLTFYTETTGLVAKASNIYKPASESPTYSNTSYDGLGRAIKITHADGTFSTVAYAPSDLGVGWVRACDELNHCRAEKRDIRGRVVRVREYNNGSSVDTVHNYNMRDQLTSSVDGLGLTSTVQWNSMTWKLSATTPDNGTQNFTYDDAGQLLSATNSRGQVTSSTYDSLGRPLTMSLAGTLQTSMSYDEAGKGASKGRMTKITYPGGNQTINTYDWAGRATSVSETVLGVTKSISQSYDAFGRLIATTYPDSEVINYNYNAAGEVSSVPGYVTAMNYDPRGLLTGVSYANGVTGSFSYDPARKWLNTAQFAKSGSVLWNGAYSYDAAARTTKTIATDATNAAASGTSTYTYDDLNRLTSSTLNSVVSNFSYDWGGRITNTTALGNYTYGTAHPHAVLTANGQTYAYDADGNMLSGKGRTMVWDAANRLLSASRSGATSEYTYGTGEERIAKNVNGAITRYFFSREVEVAPDGSLIKMISAGGLLVAEKKGSVVTFKHTDRQGSTRLMTDASGVAVGRYDYKDFGDKKAEVGAAAVANDDRWQGHKLDIEADLYYMGGRFYDASLGRFISADSIVPDDKNPQAFDRYAFAFNNPISNLDPTGHMPIITAISAVFGTIGVSAPAWIVGVSIVGAVAQVAGYITGDPTLQTIGAVALGFAGGWTGGAGYLGFPGFDGAFASAAISFALSPLSPLDSNLKTAIGWAYGQQMQMYKDYINNPANWGDGKPVLFCNNVPGPVLMCGQFDRGLLVVRPDGSWQATFAGMTNGVKDSSLASAIRLRFTSGAQSDAYKSMSSVIRGLKLDPSKGVLYGYSLGNFDVTKGFMDGLANHAVGVGTPKAALYYMKENVSQVNCTGCPARSFTLALGDKDPIVQIAGTGSNMTSPYVYFDNGKFTPFTTPLERRGFNIQWIPNTAHSSVDYCVNSGFRFCFPQYGAGRK